VRGSRAGNVLNSPKGQGALIGVLAAQPIGAGHEDGIQLLGAQIAEPLGRAAPAPTYSTLAPEFRQRIVELVRRRRTPEELARQFEPSAQAIRNRGAPGRPE